MKESSHATPVIPSPSPRREKNAETLSISMDEPMKWNERFKTDLLARDNFRCVATGQINTAHFDLAEDTTDLPMPSDMEAAHIIPFFYDSWTSNKVNPPRPQSVPV